MKLTQSMKLIVNYISQRAFSHERQFHMLKPPYKEGAKYGNILQLQSNFGCR
jgi:hypothetical protein